YLASGNAFDLATNYLGNGSTVGTTRASARNILAKPVRAFGSTIGYLHRWTPNLRSTISAGIDHRDINTTVLPASARASFDKELVSAHLNLVWSPVAFVDVGVEYVWIHRVVVANFKGDVNALVSKFAIRF